MLVLAGPIFWHSLSAVEALRKSHYFGPGNTMPEERVELPGNTMFDLTTLDQVSFVHDTAYERSQNSSARSRRVARTKADYAMSGQILSSNPVVGLAMFAAASTRVLTFNLFDMPWDP